MSFGIFRRPRAGRTQSALLVLLLLVTLVVSGVLTQQGSEAARGQEQALEMVLRTNASFVAGRYAEQSQVDVRSILTGLFMNQFTPTNTPINAADFRPAAMDARFVKQCQCDPEPLIAYHFSYDYGSNRLSFQKGNPGADEERTLRLVLNRHPTERLRTDWEFAVAAPGELGSKQVAAFAIQNVAGRRHVAIGFVGVQSLIAPFLTPLSEFNTAMPGGEPDRFAIEVTSRSQLIFAGAVPASQYSASIDMEPAFGGFRVQASVNPNYVPAMAGSSIPRSKAVVFIGLLGLSVVLIVAALFLFRRESELGQARSDFVANVSHELRTPLAQIRMFTETLLLGRTRNEAERRRSLEIIDQEAKRLTALVENVLSLGRTERGAARLAPSATELAPMIREVMETFSQMPRARTSEFRAELEPRLIASVDPGAFRQILLNLLDNAVKYGPSGQRVVVGLAMFEEHARLWVDDEGPGIPVRERERVFEPFYRATTHADSSVAGSGIGLAVVRELAVLLGGRAWTEPAPGTGARIIVEFPDAYLRANEATGNWAVA